MLKLPKACGDKHVAAFKRDRELGICLLKKLIARAGLTNEEYINLFYES